MTGADLSPRVGGILLAAGGSSRMGRPKQLVKINGIALLRNAAENMAASKCTPRVVVLGAEFERCIQELDGTNIDTTVNTEWASGMSSSIQIGLAYMMGIKPQIDAVIITLCDQPNITTAIIDNFIAEYRRIRPCVIASEYNGVTGVPALFSRDMFDDILKLEGDRGARDLIRAAGHQALRLSVPEAAFDIDSPHDLMSVGDPIK